MDLRTKLRLYLGHSQAMIIQDYDCVALVVEQAFGGGGKTKSGPPTTTTVASSAVDMQKSFQGMFAK